MNNFEKYTEIFITVFGIEAGVLNENFTFKNINEWDSMTHMSLITELEDTFDIMFETEDIINYGSYLNGIEILKKYGVSFE